ncbi:hypothetical protein HYY69_02370 [Candidatus Woesearchaeota archaeon]|nr:hypothetical protein [Candidatus Woesearchaeota archaeon]
MEHKYNWVILAVVAAVGVFTLFFGTNNNNNMTGYAFVDAGMSKSQVALDYYQERLPNGDRAFVVLTSDKVEDILLYKWRLGTIRETRSAKEEGLLTEKGATFIEPLYNYKTDMGYVYTVRALHSSGKMTSHYKVKNIIAYNQKQLSKLRNEKGTFTHQ